jgi:hypothetical protein
LRSELEAVALTSDGGESTTAEKGSALAITEAIDAYGGDRLLSFDRDPLLRSPTVEIAHDALLREWRRLRRWLDEGRTNVRTLRAWQVIPPNGSKPAASSFRCTVLA